MVERLDNSFDSKANGQDNKTPVPANLAVDLSKPGDAALQKPGFAVASLPPNDVINAQALAAGDPAKAVYDAAQTAYQKELDQYWQKAEVTKHTHQKVTDFPPDYHGPAKPAGYDPPKPPSKLPSVNDMVSSYNQLERHVAVNAKINPMGIEEVPENDFKKAYVREALNVGALRGLDKATTRNIVQNIYAFEDGGRGTADMLSGVPMRLTAPDSAGSHTNFDERRAIHPLSTAMGYNQLLMATSLRFIDGSHSINDRLSELADPKKHPEVDAGRRQILDEKNKNLTALQAVAHTDLMTMAKGDTKKYLDAQGNPNYALYTDFAKSLTPGASGMSGRQIASALQALNLDRDIGPIIQAQQLDDILQHGINPAFKGDLQAKAAEDAKSAAVFDKLGPRDKAAAIKDIVDHVAPMPLHGAKIGLALNPGSSSDIASRLAVRASLQKALTAFAADDKTPMTEASMGKSAMIFLPARFWPSKNEAKKAGLSPMMVPLWSTNFFTSRCLLPPATTICPPPSSSPIWPAPIPRIRCLRAQTKMIRPSIILIRSAIRAIR